MDKALVTFFGIAGIIFTYWFFLMKKSRLVDVTSSSVDISVEGGYTPEVISIPKGETTKLIFTRKDPNSCLEEIILPAFKIKKFLPLNESITIEITPQRSGEYAYSCGMNMFHGKIVVV